MKALTTVNTAGGPGTNLHNIIPEFFQGENCGCEEYAAKMDAWGPDGCEQRFDEIIQHLEKQAARIGWTAIIPQSIQVATMKRWLRRAIDKARTD